MLFNIYMPYINIKIYLLYFLTSFTQLIIIYFFSRKVFRAFDTTILTAKTTYLFIL